MNDNKAQIHHMRVAHEVADKHADVDPATRSNAALAPRPGLGPAGSA